MQSSPAGSKSRRRLAPITRIGPCWLKRMERRDLFCSRNQEQPLHRRFARQGKREDRVWESAFQSSGCRRTAWRIRPGQKHRRFDSEVLSYPFLLISAIRNMLNRNPRARSADFAFFQVRCRASRSRSFHHVRAPCIARLPPRADTARGFVEGCQQRIAAVDRRHALLFDRRSHRYRLAPVSSGRDAPMMRDCRFSQRAILKRKTLTRLPRFLIIPVQIKDEHMVTLQKQI